MSEKKIWTVQLMALLPQWAKVEVEASNIEEACEKALEKEQGAETLNWEFGDEPGPTFVNWAGEGQDTNPKGRDYVEFLDDDVFAVPKEYDYHGRQHKNTELLNHLFTRHEQELLHAGLSMLRDFNTHTPEERQHIEALCMLLSFNRVYIGTGG